MKNVYKVIYVQWLEHVEFTGFGQTIAVRTVYTNYSVKFYSKNIFSHILIEIRLSEQNWISKSGIPCCKVKNYFTF